MILGIGIDQEEIDRIEKAINLFKNRFLNRIFTPHEIQSVSDRTTKQKRLGAYTARFCAKEACSKALGCGIGKHAFWQDFEVINLPSGQPEMVIKGKALQKLQEKCPEGYQTKVHLSLSDTKQTAVAFVIIEAIKI
jgi:holo-[acyl-carrier protein] synthase